MKKNKIILLLAGVGFVASAFYGGHEYFKPNPDMTQLKPSFQVDAPALIQEFNENDSAATSKYLGKIVVAKGTIKEIEKDGKGFYTIVLGSKGDMSSVRCAIDNHYNNSLTSLQIGSFAEVKGSITGFNKDETGMLGSDVQLNRCVVNNMN